MDECSQMYCAIHWIEIYPVDSVIRPSNYRGQIERSGFKLKPGHCVVFISKRLHFQNGSFHLGKCTGTSITGRRKAGARW